MPEATAAESREPRAAGPEQRAQRAECDRSITLTLHRDAPDDVASLPLDLFRDARFYALHRDAFPRAWYAVARDAMTGSCLAAGWFAEVAPGHARSPGRGTFGGLQLTSDRVSLARREAIACELDRALRAEGVRRATIALPPSAHAPHDHAEWASVLLRAGWVPATPEVNYALDVNDEPLDRRMNSGNRQVARGAVRRGLEFRALRADERAEAFAVNAENRAKRGYPLTMTFDAFIAMEDAFPDRVLWFGVFYSGRMIAANVSLLVAPDVLYVFYWGEVRGVETLSPVTILADGIYRECQRRGVRLLDIGIATVDGVPNHGLVAYKRNLGCTASLKLTLTKELI